jgi:hypothetical protein
LITYEDRIRYECLQAKRTGDLGSVIALLRESNQDALADLMQQVKVKRPRGNPRGADPWVSHAVLLAGIHKLGIRVDVPGRRPRSKRGENIDDTAIKLAVADMRKNGLPMRPDEDKFTEKVRNKLRRSQPKGGDDFATMLADASSAWSEIRFGLYNYLVRTKPRRSRQPRKRK